MQPIFNSLGSNYPLSFIFLALRQIVRNKRGKQKDSDTLKSILEKQFGGKCYLFYKGRDAIEYSLKAVGIRKGDSVIIQAFTCYAIEESIVRSGATPVFADLASNSLNPTLETLEKAYRKAKKPKAVLIQHTLGFPAEICKIRRWCNRKKLLLIEDLAQAFGGKGDDNKVLGTNGDIVILSFGKDKILDGVSGGGCVIKISHNHIQISSRRVEEGQVVKDMFYPLVTWVIRRTYLLGLGKLLHEVARLTKLIVSPVVSYSKEPLALPEHYAALVLHQLNELDKQLAHRRAIAKLYAVKLRGGQIQLKTLTKASNLRFPVTVSQPDSLTKYLRVKNIYIEDRWYKRAVDCGSLCCKTVYKNGECPNAEKWAATIINLPTHKSITKKEASKIIQVINQCIS
ncbi:MAG: DegT/DnrJ/EryC1/StrS family aminotransferase [Patescibacteria group bacterium]|jgi:perosamine synthetase